MSVIVGIDPGVSGAVVWMNDHGRHMGLVCDMPTIEIRGKRIVDGAGLAEQLQRFGISMVVLEHVQGVQQSGATSAFSFGRGFGIIEGVIAGLKLPSTLVRPQVWTRAMSVGSDKGAHRDAARRRWPECAELFARVRDDGRADAALLCEWWRTHRASAE